MGKITNPRALLHLFLNGRSPQWENGQTEKGVLPLSEKQMEWLVNLVVVESDYSSKEVDNIVTLATGNYGYFITRFVNSGKGVVHFIRTTQETNLITWGNMADYLSPGQTPKQFSMPKLASATVDVMTEERPSVPTPSKEVKQAAIFDNVGTVDALLAKLFDS